MDYLTALHQTRVLRSPDYHRIIPPANTTTRTTTTRTTPTNNTLLLLHALEKWVKRSSLDDLERLMCVLLLSDKSIDQS